MRCSSCLQKSYAGRVKVIYIDPPYNTGNDFIYSDDYHDSIQNYLEITRQTENGRIISSNKETNGRFHTDWLNMLYPRLKVARNLLSQDGVIFISIDDNEAEHLKDICNELFGEENFLACLVWEKKKKGSFLSDDRASMKEYIYVFTKNKDKFKGLIGQINDATETYPCINANNKRELRVFRKGIPSKYSATDFSLKKGTVISETTMSILLHSDLIIKNGVLDQDLIAESNWRYNQDALDEYFTKNEIYITRDLYFRRIVSDPRHKPLKDLLLRLASDDETSNGSTGVNIKNLFATGWGTNEDADEEQRLLFGVQKLMDYPKPSVLILKLLASVRDNDLIVLDFFAGSGTTGDAVMRLNSLDEGCRRYILVQLDENLDKSLLVANGDSKKSIENTIRFLDGIHKPHRLSEVTKERLRRSANKIKEGAPQFAGDLGFRVFKLDTSNIQAWEMNNRNLPLSLENAVQHLKTDRSEADILYELLLKLGLDLCVPIEMRTIAGKAVQSIGKGVLLVCLAEQITREEAEPVALGIVDWHKELAPAGETTCVFRDSSFADDVAKSNLAAILDQYGLSNMPKPVGDCHETTLRTQTRSSAPGD